MALKKETEEQTLETFDWDNEVSFFDIKAEEVAEDVVTEVKEKENEEALEKEAKSKKDTVNEDGTAKVEDDPAKVDDKSNVKDSEKETFFEEDPTKETNTEEVEEVDFPTFFKTELIQNVEFDAEEELDSDGMVELFQKEKEAYADEIIEGFKEDAGEQGVAFIKYVTSGGNPEDFFSLYKEAVDAPEVDIEDENGQDEVLEFYLDKYEKLDKEDIKDRLEWLTENGKKKKYAEKAQKEITEDYKTRKEELLEKEKEQANLQEQKRKEVSNDLKTQLSEATKIGNYTITKDDKKNLLSDIIKNTVKIGPNRFITPLQKKIGDIFKNPEKLILLAKIVMSDFDTSDIETKTATKVAKKVRNKLSTSGKTKLSSQPSSKSRNLSDFFTDD